VSNENKENDDSQSNLEEFFGSTNSETRESTLDAPAAKEDRQHNPSSKDFEAQSEADFASENDEEPEETEEIESVIDLEVGDEDTPSSLPPSFLLSVDYAGNKKKAIARLYEPNTKKIYFWFDNTGHQPYCYSDLPPQSIEQIGAIAQHPGFVRTENVTMYDLLHDKQIEMTKIIADDPLSIGGRPNSIREKLRLNDGYHAWEANIRYRNCFTYDRNLISGLIYKIENGNLVPVPPELDANTHDQFVSLFKDETGLERIIDTYAPMFFTKVPDIRRIALDIEVYSPVMNRIPSADTAPEMVTAIGLADNESFNKCLVLRRKGHPEGPKSKDFPPELEIIYFDDEAEMLVEAFRIINEYPIVLTFVGDAFDLNYLYHRAERLHIDMNRYCPIKMARDLALLEKGIHVDLYRFLKNPSVRLYALSGAYEQTNLESIAQGLLGIGKLELSTEIAKLPYNELAHYCWRDSKITLEITRFNNNLLLRLIVLLMRISRLSMEDVTRLGISSWIQSLFRQEHRSQGFLIPRQSDIESAKSADAHTEAIIDGKAFKGAIVIEPVAGVHFNATVLDFASLYPTIMKRHNISYETVDCPHEECRLATGNRVPETDHWICTKRRGMISETIGFFRDTRVKWFKSKSKDKSVDKTTRDWYGVVEKALKVYLNASYGVTGAQHFELFCMPAAESVTAYGRNAIVRTKEKAEAIGVRVLYGDTDSVFLDNPSKEQQDELVRWSRKELGIDLEVEKTYKYVALSERKKNYIGVYPSGYVEVKGLSGKKRNTPMFVQDAFQDMLEVLGRVNDLDGFKTAKEEIREIINHALDRLEGKSEEYTPEDLAFRVQMTKSIENYGKTIPQHVRAAMMLKDAGYVVPAGTIVEYVKTKGTEGVLPIQLAREQAYWLDKDKYIDTLRSVFEQVLDSVGINFEELLGFTTLDQFF
jgi:DNA polymerase I